MIRSLKALGLVIALSVVVLPFAGCGGGGGGGGGSGGGGSPVLLLITAAGTPSPLWQNVAGTPVSPPQCPNPVYLNSTITFTFGGAVSAASLPSGGFALGSINITTTSGTGTTAALGSFTVGDDPSLPPGNNRRVNFLPTPPADPNNPNTAGLAGNVQYTIFVPKAGSTAQVVQVAGASLSTEALTCFQTCNSAALGSACFTDPRQGPPFVTSTTPVTNDPSPPAINPTQVGNVISMFFSEPLFPSGININNVVVRTQSGAQVPGAVVFHQAGSPEAGPLGARIDYIASSQLLSNATYEIVISNQVRDFGANPVVLYDPTASTAPPSGRRFFQTITVPTCPQAPIAESFDTTQNRSSVSGIVLWNGTGQVVSTFPSELVGNGAFGPLNFASGPGTLDPGMPTIINGGQVAFQEGAWNTTSVNIAAGANVRCTGHSTGNLRRVHLRSLGTIDVTGTLNANAGTSITAPIGDVEQGPRAGNFNNGTPGNPTWVAGGVGGSGGGRGGDSSQADKTGPPLRTNQGEAGFGPPVNGQVNTGPFGANPLFGGGPGGQSGFTYPQGGQPGEVGGLGAAGGSAFGAGANGGPNAAAPACTPVAPTVQTRALATGQTPAFVTPISQQSAGSGGGGGGDRTETAGVGSDDQGGGGGGGGGGIRMSAIGNVNINAGGQVRCNGAAGAAGNVFNGGNGGGGSGGEIWLQSFSQVVISTTANMTVDGGGVANACGNQASGRGGTGLYQFEDSDGVVNTNFAGVPVGGANVNVVLFPFSTTVVGTAISNFFDTGYGDPTYTSTQETFAIGNVPGGTVSITYQGAFENVTGGGPNLASLSPQIPGSNITALNGYRFIRFRINVSYSSPPVSNVNNTLPTIDQITINYSAPVNCP